MAKKQITLIFMFCMLIASTFSQEGITLDGLDTEPLSFAVLIDGKMPLSLFVEVSWGNATEKQTLTYRISYNKSILVSHDDLSILDTLSGKTDMHVKIFFEEALGYKKEIKHVYSFDIKWGLLQIVRIVTITNLNKKQNQYYVHFILEPSWQIPVKWKKEYGNRRKFEKRVFEGLYPLYYFKLEGIEGPYPIY